MKDKLTSLSHRLGDLGDAARAALPEMPSLSFKSDVEIPIYVLHHGNDPEEYEILCDFERFVTENQSGFLSRPVLKVWAGRSDFNSHYFARNLREAFSAQFEAVRQESLASKPKRKGFIPQLSIWDIGLGIVGPFGSLLGTIVLYLAVKAGNSAIEEIRALLRNNVVGRIFKSQSDASRLEAQIEEKQAVIDAALAEKRVTLHRDLYLYAHRAGPAGSMAGVDLDAWPLTAFVTRRMAQ